MTAAAWRWPGGGQRQRLAARIAMVAPATAPRRDGRAAPVAGWRPDAASGILLRLARAGLDPLLGIDRSLASDAAMRLWPALLAAAAAGAGAFGVIAFLLGVGGIWPALAGAAAALVAARAQVAARRDAIRAVMEEQFELALGIIIRCVRAGLPVNEGMRAVALELPAPTGPEFRHAVDQMQLGTGFEEALQGLARRSAIADYRFFATAVALQRQTGGNLAETLDNLAETIRRRRAVRLRAHALTSETRATVVVLAILPAVVAAVLMLINPGYVLQLVDNPAGRRLLGIAVLVQLLGLAVIRAISRQTLR